MNLDELIEEGRQLARPCAFLRNEGQQPVVARWHRRDRATLQQAIKSGEFSWLTVDLSQVPGLPAPAPAERYLTVYVEFAGEGGRVALSSDWPEQADFISELIDLFAEAAAPLPPLDAVFIRGSDAVQQWLNENNWPPDEPYNSHFKDFATSDDYERAFQAELPLFQETDIYAMLGGWHIPWPEGDWLDLIDRTLVVWTFADSEPYVEVWRDASGNYSVIQRIS